MDKKKLIAFLKKRSNKAFKEWVESEDQRAYGAIYAYDDVLEYVIEQPKDGEWIPRSEGAPKDLVPVNVTWITCKQASCYADIKDKLFTATAVFYENEWYWWSVGIEEYLSEHGESEQNKVHESVEIIAWQTLPEPWRGETSGMLPQTSK